MTDDHYTREHIYPIEPAEPVNTYERVERAKRFSPDCKHRQLIRVGANSFQCSRCGLVYTASLSPFNGAEADEVRG